VSEWPKQREEGGVDFRKLGVGVLFAGLAACASGRPVGVQSQEEFDRLVQATQGRIASLDEALAVPCPGRGQDWAAAKSFIGDAPLATRAEFRRMLAEENAAYNAAIKGVDDRVRKARQDWASLYASVPDLARELREEADRDREAFAAYHAARAATLYGRHVAYVIDLAARDSAPLPANWAADSSSHPYFRIFTSANAYNDGWDMAVSSVSPPSWASETASTPYYAAWRTRAEQCVDQLKRQLFESSATQIVEQARAAGRSSSVRQMLNAQRFRAIAQGSPVLEPVASQLAALEQQFRSTEDAAQRRADEERRAADARAAQLAAAAEADRIRRAAENDRAWRAAWRGTSPRSREFICEGTRDTRNELGTAILGLFNLPDTTRGDKFGFRARFNDDFSVMEASLTTYAGIGPGRHPVRFVGPSKVQYEISYEVRHGGGRVVNHAGAAVIDLSTGQLRGAINWQAPIVGTRSTDVWSGYCSIR
jgi:hypothetical protein